MRQLTFDANGYLMPYDLIEMDWADFETHFSTNAHRKQLLSVLQDYLTDLSKVLKSPFKIWLDGSFITQKELPNDIDVVTFVNDYAYAPNFQRVQSMIFEYKIYGLDLHFVNVYPFYHKLRYETDFETNEFIDLYNSDRKGRPKGMIELKKFSI